ncbi:hypothetical protein NMY22_g14882 [Coprinellus aureogranulatus]|nr:hypothetical protein NMY22_g14882 [Coprinellus aureogranulatus]
MAGSGSPNAGDPNRSKHDGPSTSQTCSALQPCSTPYSLQSILTISFMRTELVYPTRPGNRVQAGAVPEDIWIDIAKDLEPIDVIRLGQTCRFLRGVTSTGTLWKMILRSVCSRYKLFAPSYPVDDMTVAHLQRIALGPYLWAKLVKKHAVRAEELAEQSKPITHVSTTSTATMMLRRMHDPNFMVPGGRFLVVLRNRQPWTPQETGLDSPVLELWDLGVAGTSLKPEPILISQTDTGLPPSLVIGMTVFSGEDGSTTLTAVVVSHSDDSGEHFFSVFTAEFRCERSVQPSFQPASRLVVPKIQDHLWSVVALYNNVLLFEALDNGVNLVWDFVAQTYTAFRFSFYDQFSRTTPLLFNGDTYAALLSNPNVAALSKIPKLTTIPAGRDIASFPDLRIISDAPTSTIPAYHDVISRGEPFSREGRFLSTVLPQYRDEAVPVSGHDYSSVPTADCMTRYEFSLGPGPDGARDTISYKPYMRAIMPEPKNMRITHVGTREHFSSSFFSSSQLQYFPYRGDQGRSIACIYSMIPQADSLMETQTPLEGVTERNAQQSDGRAFSNSEQTYPATLMLTPLPRNRTFYSSCISSGRLLSCTNGSDSQFFLEDYLW